jgi:ubiquinone/menaquinone biosynthesis C-methylase UbiE
MSYNFDRMSSKYDDTRALPAQVTDHICRWVLSRLPVDPTICEIGVGTGRIAIPFIQRGIRYTGFDISEQMLERARTKLGNDLQQASLLLADVTQILPLAPSSQDAAVAVHILHLVDAPRALNELRRVLKPDGVFIWGFQEQDEDSPAMEIRRHFFKATILIGAEPKRDFFVSEARQLLADWGTGVSRHAVATWSRSFTARAILESLAARIPSSTWHLTDEVLGQAIRQTEEWAKNRYGDLDRELVSEERFMVDWYTLPGELRRTE